MPTQFDLPVLDQKDYTKLFADLRQSIPKYSSTWTDYNDSDPGITILQLLSWLGDATLYRIDRLPRELYLNFARLVLGAGYSETQELIDTLESQYILDQYGSPVSFGPDPLVQDPARLALAQVVQRAEVSTDVSADELRTACLKYLQTPYRAVTAADVETILIAMTAEDTDSNDLVSKITKVVTQDLGDMLRIVMVVAWRPNPAVKINPPEKTAPANMNILNDFSSMANVWTYGQRLIGIAEKYLAPRQLVGTPTQIVCTGYMPISITGRLALLPGAPYETVFNDLATALKAWIDPLTGGADGQGWPVGRPFKTHDLIGPLKQVDGIDHSQPLELSVADFPAVTLGASRLSGTTPVSVDPAYALPVLGYVQIAQAQSTWPLQVGVHARVGVDTNLPMGGAGS